MTTHEQLRAEAAALQEWLTELRRDLHAHPELAFQELRTAGIVAQRLAELGYEVQTGVGKTGVVGILEGARAAGAAPAGALSGNLPQVLLLRFDMDALPVRELNDVPYCSRHDGVMHACGHDAHTAIGLAVAELLARHRAGWAGTVKVIFQPAEETIQGALAMIRDGVLKSPAPTCVLSMHVNSRKPLGTVHVTDGPMMAAADGFSVTVRGRGTHGANPHEGADPIVAAAQMVTALQSVVSRNISPLDTAVVTVGYIHGGTAQNIIPDVVEFGGTLRSYDEATTLLLRKRVRAIVEGIAQAMSVAVDIAFPETYAPPLMNDPAMSEIVRGVARELVGAQNVYGDYRMMGSEDAAYFLKAVPGAYAFIGAGNVEKGIMEPHHSPRFQIDEAVLPIAAALVTASAMRLLNGASS
ncbi:MAG: amidohydrolase [Chloroflexi bacterium]|nr:amidohydrolase [Chloroflexota bacterium]